MLELKVVKDQKLKEDKGTCPVADGMGHIYVYPVMVVCDHIVENAPVTFPVEGGTGTRYFFGHQGTFIGLFKVVPEDSPSYPHMKLWPSTYGEIKGILEDRRIYLFIEYAAYTYGPGVSFIISS